MKFLPLESLGPDRAAIGGAAVGEEALASFIARSVHARHRLRVAVLVDVPVMDAGAEPSSVADGVGLRRGLREGAA